MLKKSKYLLLVIVFLQQAFALSSFLPKPYSELKEVLPFNNHGWYGNANYIEKLMKQNKITTFIEIGSWLGASTRHIASLLQKNGQLYAVDTWQGSEEHFTNKEWAAMLSLLYEQFLSNMIHANITNIVIPLRMKSVDAAPVLAEKLKQVDMVYVDGAHDAQSVFNDLQAYWPFVEKNDGILCGDDWKWGSVAFSVKRFASLYHLTVYSIENFWFLKKESGYTLKSLDDSAITPWVFYNLQ